MKQASSSSRSGLLLMEIIIAILFFSLASAICLQLFVKAHNLGQDTQELDMAVRQASSVADVLSQSERPLELLRELYPDADIDAVQSHIYYDQSFRPCGNEASNYRLDISAAADDAQTSIYTIAVYNDETGDEIYGLEVMSYQPFTPGAPLAEAP
ncbi:MAG: hypothetical protein HFI89_12960 [Lachnospiraceae bacterium]|nr:hypothetical protein [Lachnospiraceae bacterium]